ncbi:DUF6794 domain-containing protein [Psychroserpens sp. SPM9]|uniref:DUF6794 domain-containing protein n=1 Tax=Psychroserpens sp. SPM9 TaxID=2975598 RepID=UPI0021A83FD2|nr:DUF6794 domain-containing protein [Psychroserpens sp. SPM9]MDG5493263.1 hypothetical protein [Psychroserpens sp. SPM9]
MKNIIVLISISIFLSCQEKEKIPNDLNIAFDYINEKWDKKSIEQFKNRTEDDTTFVDYHFGIGLNIRNYLLRNGEHSEKLTRFFDSIGVHHYDDMSSIIIESYHKHLNNKDIELESQVNSVKEYWKPIIDCAKIQEKKGLEIYQSYAVNDTINIKMPVSESNSVVDYPCPTMDWEYDEKMDLSIDGIIIEKGFSVGETNVYFTVRILNKSHEGTKIMMSKKNVGDEFTIMLRQTVWKIKTTGNNVYN